MARTTVIVVRAGAMLFLRLTGNTARTTGRLAVESGITSGRAGRLVAGNTVAWGKLDFQLDDFIPLLVGAVTLRN